MLPTAKLCRRVTPKTFALSAICLTVLLCVYYASYTTDDSGGGRVANRLQPGDKLDDARFGNAAGRQGRLVQESAASGRSDSSREREGGNGGGGTCPKLAPNEADVSTMDVFKDFEFQPTWMKSKEYWDKSFEDRYERQKMDPDRQPLKVFIVPHSHNDPGWLKTFEHYFHYSSRQIMNNMVAKLQQYKNLTFIWSEVAFLNAWWEEAHPSKQRALRALVQSGRLEITTGGWVMTDEANAHVFAMVDQLIEGHQWVWSNLGIRPKSGWSVDPFGHGATQPYIMAQSGITGAVVQRIHYAWKQWLALKQFGDFRWVPGWRTAASSSSGRSGGALLTHNQPFDIYSIKHSCGPHPYICLNFDFRKVTGEYTEYSIKAQTITDNNIKEKAELLLEQYARTGSLFPHNVVLMPLGDDFRYNVVEEWDQQYLNYIKLIDYINAHRDTYKTEISFGTPSQYFEEITKRSEQFPTLKGDFFVYSDIFSEGRPAYWSGYFTTRPFMKLLDRELESSLRGAEILYTIALNTARQNKILPYLKILERDFEKLVRARRNLGLFQHHDAITGTSKSFVMRDYGLKLFESIRDTTSVQQNALQSLLSPTMPIKPDQIMLLSDLERESYEKLPKKTVIGLGPALRTKTIILYNSLASEHEQLVQVRTNTSNVRVTDGAGNAVVYQVNPVWDVTDGSAKLWIAADEFEVVFVARVRPLAAAPYTLVYQEEAAQLATVYCNKCHRRTNIVSTGGAEGTVEKSKFLIKTIPSGDIQMENHKVKVMFDGTSGFMKSITRKHAPRKMQCQIQFAAYRSAQFHSGAYLFMPDPNEREIEKDVLQQYKDQMTVIITSGAVSSEITAIYGPFLMHSVLIYHDERSSLADALHVESVVDFENPPKNRETELFMRVISDVQNGEPPEFYTDSSGFQMQKRVKVEKIGIEGNYFPITTMAYIQDENVRLSLLTNHAQGAASWQPGFLEVMLDRRTLYDDSRGMGEGLVDNRKTVNRFWLLIEDVAPRNPVASDTSGAAGNSAKQQRFETGGSDSDDDAVFEKGDILRTFNVPTDAAAESQNGGSGGKPEAFAAPSLRANHLSNSLNYPLNVFIVEGEDAATGDDRPNGGGGRLAELRLLNSKNSVNAAFPCDVHLLNLRTQPDPVYAQFPSANALLVLHRQGHDCGVHRNFSCLSANFAPDLRLGRAEIARMHATTLTGIGRLDDDDDDGEERDKVRGLGDIALEPMALKSYNLTFV